MKHAVGSARGHVAGKPPRAAVRSAAVLVFLVGSAWRAEARQTPWAEVLGPSAAQWPEPQAEVVWRTELDAALAEARAQERPLFVTLRCLPCKQCADFDRDLLEGGAALDPLLRRFVTVRLTSMREVDGRVLPYAGFQDLDLSWWGYLLSPRQELYAVYGGRDEVSDTTRISIPSLASVLRRVLDHHYDPRRPGWGLEAAPEPPGEALTPTSLPGWRAWAARGAAEAKEGQCLHCHQVAEVLRQPAIDAGRFDRRTDFFVWPLPENVGIVLERDHGLRVREVAPESPAARAGLAPGDVLGAAGGQRLFGQADLRGVLHRLPPDAAGVELVWTRGGEVRSGVLELAPGWRATELSWRISVVDSAVGAHPGFAWAHPVDAAERERRGIPAGTLAARPWFGKNEQQSAAFAAGLRESDVIVALDGQSPDVAGRSFMLWFRLNKDPGGRIELTVAGPRGARRTVAYELPGR